MSKPSGLIQNLRKLPITDILQAIAAAIAIYEALKHSFGW
jgi:hypothetical protein